MLLGVGASLWFSAKYRQPCRTSWKRGAWAHRYREATIPTAVVGAAPPYKDFIADARDAFLYEYEPGEGDVVFDIGAGIGAETLLFSRLVGKTGLVIALEAHPDTYLWLVRLCELNKLENVLPLQLAASDVDGEVLMSDLDDYVANTLLEVNGEGIMIQARRLDDVARDLGIASIDFLKMNIEGAESAALSGMERLIRSTRHVCIACHDFRAEGGDPDTMRTKSFVQGFLRDHSFSLTTRDSPHPWIRDYFYGINASFSGGSHHAGRRRP
jgi:FkbM family methyltransferase